MRPLGQCQIYHWWLLNLRSEQLGISFINSSSLLHLIIISLSTTFKSSEWYLIVLERRHMLRISYLDESGDIASLRITVTRTKVGILHTRNMELTWTVHFEVMCMRRRIIGLLQSQDLDGKPTFGFIVTGWSVNELLCLKAPRGGIVLIIAEDDRVLWRSTWFVETEDWDFRLIELFLSLCLEGVTEDCRSRLYGNVLIKKYPPGAMCVRPIFTPSLCQPD